MEERFWDKVDKTDDCWLWTACKFWNGYGQFWKDGKMVGTHRLSWLLSGRTIPEGHLIRHKCRNRHCVNPEHLETGTMAENIADRDRDGTTVRGEKSPNAKLTEQQVLEIRARANDKIADIAKDYNITFQNVSSIILRQTWKHI